MAILINNTDEVSEEVPALDFKIHASDGRVIHLTLPVLGEKNVPLGLMATVSIAQEAIDSGETKDMARTLYGLLESMKGPFPEAYRKLWSLDFDAAIKFFKAWFESSEGAGFDPKV